MSCSIFGLHCSPRLAGYLRIEIQATTQTFQGFNTYKAVSVKGLRKAIVACCWRESWEENIFVLLMLI